MFDFFADLFSPVVNWVTDTAGAATGAVTGAVLEGAFAGAIGGAGAALINGGDVFKGALKGAAIGGVVSGVASTLLQLSGMEDFTATKQLQNLGFTPKKPPENIVKEDLIGGIFGTDPKDKTPLGGLLQKDSNKGFEKPSDKVGFWSSDAGGKIIGSTIQGLATGAGNYLSAQEEAEGQMNLLNQKAQIEKDKITANQPSKEFAAQTANIKVRSWWKDRIAEDTSIITNKINLTGVPA